jgi:hypothetical protein
MIGPSTGPVLGLGRQEIVNFQVYSILRVNLGLFWDEKFRFDEIFKIQPIQMLRKKLYLGNCFEQNLSRFSSQFYPNQQLVLKYCYLFWILL